MVVGVDGVELRIEKEGIELMVGVDGWSRRCKVENVELKYWLELK